MRKSLFLELAKNWAYQRGNLERRSRRHWWRDITELLSEPEAQVLLLTHHLVMKIPQQQRFTHIALEQSAQLRPLFHQPVLHSVQFLPNNQSQWFSPSLKLKHDTLNLHLGHNFSFFFDRWSASDLGTVPRFSRDEFTISGSPSCWYNSHCLVMQGKVAHQFFQWGDT